MVKEGTRRNYKPYKELTPDALIKGEYPCPFNESEIALLSALRDGFDGAESDVDTIGMSAKTLKNHKVDISEKITGIYFGNGDDHIAKALSISILGGWVNDKVFEGVEAELSGIEFLYLFQRCFGHTPKQIIREMHVKPEEFNGIFMGIKDKLNIRGDYQLIAWGASRARQWLRDNPGIKPPFFTT